MTVVDTLRQRIGAAGPIPFEVFMGIALYGEGGFFNSGPLRSAATGDFLTSPEVSPWFGRIIGRYLAARDVATLVEVAAGSGSLLRPLLDEMPHDDVWAVEASPIARAALEQLLPDGRVVATLDGLPSRFSGALIANELIDNLPVAIAVKTSRGWAEHYVGFDEDRFTAIAVPVRPAVAAWADAYGGAVAVDGIVEVQLGAADWLSRAIDVLERGVIVLFDYGGTVEELEPRRSQGTLRTYRGHHLGPDPLLEPGQTDITVDVNFTALLRVAEQRGLVAELHRQDDFLVASGLRQVVSDLRQRELELARSGATMQQLTVKSERLDVETLLHPRGLGDFRVLTIEI
jgi:SAM-dependent MidA family methyltransferase